jgi:5-methyltetrahydropteroyltriglutamate--homocysteine methyltransferase
MQLLTASAGSYPRIGDEPEQQRLRRAYAQLAAGAITAAEVRSVEDQVAAEVLAEQAAAGIDIVTDGLVRWYDPVSHTARTLGGVTVDGLLRFFDTNFYFRQPVVLDRITRTRPIVTGEYVLAVGRSIRPVKVVLTGPCTLARASLVRTSAYPSTEALVLAYAEVLATEVTYLAAAGARHLQIDEPAVLRAPGDLPLLARALETIAAAKHGIELTLATYFGDAAPLLAALQELPVDVLAVDLVSGPDLADRLLDGGSAKRVALGLLDGRSTRLEDVAALAPRLERLLAALPPGPHYLTTSCGLEYLPRAAARRKLERLSEIRRALAGAPA